MFIVAPGAGSVKERKSSRTNMTNMGVPAGRCRTRTQIPAIPKKKGHTALELERVLTRAGLLGMCPRFDAQFLSRKETLPGETMLGSASE
jgi:hypothetical protein